MSDRPCTKPETVSYLTGYRTHGCRCAQCTEANRDAIRHWRWRTGRVKRRLVDVNPDDGMWPPLHG